MTRKYISSILKRPKPYLRISDKAAFEDREKQVFYSTPIRTTRKINSL